MDCIHIVDEYPHNFIPTYNQNMACHFLFQIINVELDIAPQCFMVNGALCNSSLYFMFQAFDDHVKWCEEKKRRLQDSPKKDHEALAKLSLRTTYKPKTPVAARKSLPSNGQNQQENKSDDRKESFESTKSEPIPSLRTKRKVLKTRTFYQI